MVISFRLKNQKIHRTKICTSDISKERKHRKLKSFTTKLVGWLSKIEIVNMFNDQNVSQAKIYRAIRECGRPCVLSQNRTNKLVQLLKSGLESLIESWVVDLKFHTRQSREHCQEMGYIIEKEESVPNTPKRCSKEYLDVAELWDEGILWETALL